MSRIEIIHFDSLNQQYNSSSQFNTYPIVNGSATSGPNSFNCDFALPSVKRNIKKISLKSIELPLAFPNVRANSNLNTIRIATTLVGNVYSGFYDIVLPDKIYRDINTLLSDINTQYAILYPSVNIIFGLNSNGNVQVSSTSSGIFTNIYVVNTNLSYLLGFRTNNTMSTRLTVAISPYTINIDNYINMYITNVSSPTTNANNTLCHFKVPLNATNGVIYYNAESNSFPQTINVNPSLIISKLTVIMTDRFGFSLHSNNIDYSFSLAFEN